MNGELKKIRNNYSWTVKLQSMRFQKYAVFFKIRIISEYIFCYFEIKSNNKKKSFFNVLVLRGKYMIVSNRRKLFYLIGNFY